MSYESHDDKDSLLNVVGEEFQKPCFLVNRLQHLKSTLDSELSNCDMRALFLSHGS